MIRTSALAASLLVAGTPAANGAVVFDFDFSDPSNATFFSTATAEGQARRDTLTETGDYLAGLLSAYTATVSFEVTTFSNGSSTLARGGQTYSFSTSAEGPIRGQVEREILGGEAISGNTASIEWNRNQDFYTGADPTGISSGESDFRSVALHEFTHALGWLSLIDGEDGSGVFASNDRIYGIYDASLRDADGNPLIDASGNYVGTASDLEGPVFFAAADGTSHRTAVTGDDFDAAHLEPGIDSLMNPAIFSGTTERVYTDADLAILATIGYTAIPEPAAAAALAVAGLLVLRRRHAA
ncbi:hypothetical protein [Phycisphaera mikurensis]|uniref:PEP-CTERM protein-sorting domain-containing protein n=1 Tax=Phycisphaera mikurensis (strain NBRC 102666 / KCTC 22515 / FYK2301M01) TaxID=1142394 RepID=I0IDM3_PHYMF|nr:hypothetical protein [Phycisphaera mikurensis]MBB6441180.1 hypothetical protein [Phycisphaera mikurensis]BAM03361.1 hypothetical protein PSMK_12020 [Phycisphaera mikurensis NBRC 102666]